MIKILIDMFRKKVLFLMLTLLTIPVFVSAGNYSSVQSSAQVLPSSSVSKCQGDTALIRVPAEFVAANNAYQWFKTTNMAVPVSNEEKMVVEVNASKSYCLYVIDDTNDTLAIKYFVAVQYMSRRAIITLGLAIHIQIQQRQHIHLREQMVVTVRLH